MTSTRNIATTPMPIPILLFLVLGNINWIRRKIVVVAIMILKLLSMAELIDLLSISPKR